MKKKTGVLLFALLFVLATVTAGCGGPSAEREQAAPQILELNLANGEPTSLDPAQAFDQDSMDVVNSLFEGLMRLNKDHQPEPAVAEKVDKSDDLRTYTFTLRKDAKWSNGELVTAHDFEYAWKRVLNPKTASSASYLMYFIKNGEKYNAGKASADEVGVKAKDDHTLVVELEKPTPFFEELTCYTVYAPVYKKGLEQNQDLYGNGKEYVGNGPFVLKSWKHDSKIVTEKNKYYRDADAVKLNGIEWNMYADEATAYQMYQSGKLHINGYPPVDLKDSLIKKGEAKVTSDSGLEFYRFNVNKKPFTNEKIRRAFALAVDRQLLVDRVVRGQEKIATAFVAPGTTSESGDFRADGPSFFEDAQFDQAKKLLREGMKEEGWKELPTVELLLNKDSDKNKKVAEAIQEMYRKHLGVNIKLRAMETKVFFDNQKSQNYTLSRSTFLPDYNDPYNYLESFQTDHPTNRTGWSNKKYDELLKKAGAETDESKRIQLLHEAEKILMKEMPIIPLYYYNDVYMQKPEVKHVLRHTVGPNDYKYVTLEN
ncbi:dipeptide-binding protein DppE [Marinithermofilum abyssi]|uniref:Dipeptide-binding protein DppE n=1 Tax=Marinithermofilum abyssi TaxID=1571185 RepID=A0A8J2YDX5_9BACL|nr:peptide ABC transporter substrate-binding protein [Marinithermofilum abyssi]GGE14976.1 dipeptide-binding protein DppE [Marinithermofilum abyssi]